MAEMNDIFIPHQPDIPPEIFVALANASWPPFIFSMIIGIPSAILYAFQIVMTISKRNEFKSSFFILFATRAFWSLIGLIANFLYSRFGRVGWFLPIYLLLPRFCLAFFYFLIVHSFHAEILSTTVLLLNRLSSLLYPVNYEKFWHKRIVLIIVAISGLPLILSGHILFYDEYVRIQADNMTTFTVDNHPQLGDWNDVFVSTCSGIVFAYICLLINFGIIFTYRRNLKKIGLNEQQHEQYVNGNTKRIERKLTIYAIATFIAQFIYAAYMLLLHIAISFQKELGFGPVTGQMFFLAVFNQIAWVNDFSTIVVPSWLMLCASSLMQTQLKGIIPSLNKSNWQQRGPRIAWSQTPNPQHDVNGVDKRKQKIEIFK